MDRKSYRRYAILNARKRFPAYKADILLVFAFSRIKQGKLRGAVSLKIRCGWGPQRIFFVIFSDYGFISPCDNGVFRFFFAAWCKAADAIRHFVLSEIRVYYRQNQPRKTRKMTR